MSEYAKMLACEYDLKARGTDLPKENAVEAIDHMVGLLRHVVQRNHPHHPAGCSICWEIEQALA